jgi:hypothetical protein
MWKDHHMVYVTNLPARRDSEKLHRLFTPGQWWRVPEGIGSSRSIERPLPRAMLTPVVLSESPLRCNRRLRWQQAAARPWWSSNLRLQAAAGVTTPPGDVAPGPGLRLKLYVSLKLWWGQKALDLTS